MNVPRIQRLVPCIGCKQMESWRLIVQIRVGEERVTTKHFTWKLTPYEKQRRTHLSKCHLGRRAGDLPLRSVLDYLPKLISSTSRVMVVQNKQVQTRAAPCKRGRCYCVEVLSFTVQPTDKSAPTGHMGLDPQSDIVKRVNISNTSRR